MENFLTLLKSDIWQGIQGLLALLSILVTLLERNKKIENRNSITIIKKIPWIYIIVTIGVLVAASFLISGAYGNAVFFIIYTVFITLLIYSAKQYLSIKDSKENIEALQKRNSLLDVFIKEAVRIITIFSTKYCSDDMDITHEINSQGDDITNERLTIKSYFDPVFFYVKYYSFQEWYQVSAKNIEANLPLRTLDVDTSSKRVKVAVLFDRPVIVNNPLRLEVTIKRNGIWKKLIEELEDDGSILVRHQSNNLTIRLVCPPNMIFTGFNPAPNVGNYTISQSQHIITWTVDNPEVRSYTYKVYSKRKE